MRNAKALFFFIILLIAACRPASRPPSTAKNVPLPLDKKLWELSRDASLKAESASDKQQKAALSNEGAALAEMCIMQNPEDAACYYYHAINTGLYYEAHVTGYQEGLKTIVHDCEKVISLNPKFDHGGAYRILGRIYMDVSETTIVKNGITRDTDAAISYLQKAVQIGPEYPENHIYIAEAFLQAGQLNEAKEAFLSAKGLALQWKNHHDYPMWQKRILK